MLNNLIKALTSFNESTHSPVDSKAKPDRITTNPLKAKPSREVVRVTGKIAGKNKANNKLTVVLSTGEALDVLIYDAERLSLKIGDRISGIPTRRLDYFEPGTVARC